MAPTHLPRQIHRYRILSEIGRGSMGRVYLAEDPNIDRRIALKVLSPQQICEPEQEAALRQRFLLEARATGRLSHPGIVTVYDADTDPMSGEPYLAMEWVKGRSLRAILEGGPLPPASAVDLAAQVARALDYAHRREVIHRDVKPANLLVTDDDTVKVVDFGIAKLMSVALTLPGAVFGTPYYMAPEQVRGERVDGRTDLFALGSVLYECVTGRLAFGGETPASVNYKIVSVEPRPPGLYNPEVPASLRRVIDRLLAKSPWDRYRTGSELAAALAAVGEELDAAAAQDAERPPAAAGEGSGAPAGRSPRLDSSRQATLWMGRPAAAKPLAAPAGGGPRAEGGERSATAEPSRETAGREGSSSDARGDREAPAPSRITWLHVATVMAVAVLLLLIERAPQFRADMRKIGEGVQQVLSQWLGPIVPPISAATLEISLTHRLEVGFVSVWIDGEWEMTARLQADDRPPSSGQVFRRQLAVRRGRRSVEIHVSGVSPEIEARNMIYADFSEGERKRLRAELKPGSEELDLTFEE